MSTTYCYIEGIPWSNSGDPTLKKCSICYYGGHIQQQVNVKSYVSDWHSICKKSLILCARPSSISRTTLLLHVRHLVFLLTGVETSRKATSPLPLILAGLSAYLACIPDVIPATTNATVYQTDIKRADQIILQTVAAYAVIFGAVRSHRLGIPWQSPSLHQTYYENLFTMAGLVGPETNRPDPTRISCFRRFGNLNAEHGIALTVLSTLVTASSLTDPVSCLISAVAAAHGPLHFGATESAQRALHDIGDPNNVPAFIEEIKSGKRKLFGYGHRTYKGMDPRVRPIQSILKDLADVHQPLLKVAEATEEVAAKDEYFSTRGLYPNADFYGNFVFTGM